MNTLKKRALVLLQPSIDEGLRRSKATQLPFKAHTSTNAKVGIIASLFLSTLALGAVAAVITHGVAKRVSPEYRKSSERTLDDLGKKVAIKVEETRAVVSRGAKDLRKRAEDTVDDIQDKVEDVAKSAKR